MNKKTGLKKSLIDISISGVFIGLACFLMKLSLTGMALNRYIIISIFSSPFTWLAIIFAVVGFVLMQRSFHAGFISISTPLLAGISIVIPVILALVLLSETIVTVKLISILLVVIGVFGLTFCGIKKKF